MLVLSQHAQCANAESAAVPLSAAERAQCQAQLTEFNLGVRAYNAELDAIKALEAEVKALSEVLDQERAAVDRHDSAAMEALNAKIDKNNALVERHGQMSSSVKAMLDVTQQRAAQYTVACENRALALSSAPRKEAAEAVCSAATGTKDLERQLQATFGEIRADQKQREAEVERISQARAKAQSWSAEKRRDIWMQLLVSPKFGAFEREKLPYVQELMRVIGSKPRSGQEECRLLRRIAAMLPAIKAINARQYTYMAKAIQAAK